MLFVSSFKITVDVSVNIFTQFQDRTFGRVFYYENKIWGNGSMYNTVR